MKYRLDFNPGTVCNEHPIEENYEALLEIQNKIKSLYPEHRVTDVPKSHPDQIYHFITADITLHESKYARQNKIPRNISDGIPPISIQAFTQKNILGLISKLLDEDIPLIFNPHNIKEISKLKA
jgi:hypothetical protein